jgi:hypothetical protein
MFAGLRWSANSLFVPHSRCFFHRSLESGIALNDVSPFIPIAFLENSLVLFCFVVCRPLLRREAVSVNRNTGPIRTSSAGGLIPLTVTGTGDLHAGPGRPRHRLCQRDLRFTLLRSSERARGRCNVPFSRSVWSVRRVTFPPCSHETQTALRERTCTRSRSNAPVCWAGEGRSLPQTPSLDLGLHSRLQDHVAAAGISPWDAS